MATDKVRKYVLPNIPYLFIGWFCLKIGTAYRGGDTNAIEVDTPKLFDKVARKWGVDYAIRRVGDEKYLLLFKARQADAITGCFAEYSRLELKRAKSRQMPIREQLRQAEEQVKKQPQRELTKEAAHGDR